MGASRPRFEREALDRNAGFSEKREANHGKRMSTSGLLQLVASTIIFLGAASGAKAWAVAPTTLKLVITLALYTVGNLIMLRLVRELGMSVAFSLSAVIQLIAVNVIALAWFGERLTTAQGAGIGLAIAAVAVIGLGPYLTGR